MLKSAHMAALLVFPVLGCAGSCSGALRTNPEPTMVSAFDTSTEHPRLGEGDLIKLKSGRILFVYTRFNRGGGDFDNADIVSRYSDDGGQTWSTDETMVVSSAEAKINVMSVSLLRLKNRQIALFYLRVNSERDSIPVMRVSKDEARTWSGPADCITAEPGYYVLNNARVIQLKSGRLLMPVAQHADPATPSNYWEGKLAVYRSDDGGKTWQRSKTELIGMSDGKRFTVQEPGLVEMKGGSVLMYCRTDKGAQYASYSTDAGVTWSDLKPTELYSPCSPALIVHIPRASDLLAIYNRFATAEAGKAGPRTPMSVAVSKDQGKTWPYHRDLETVPNANYCYPAVLFEKDYALIVYYAPGGATAGLSTHIRRVPIRSLYVDK